MKKGKSSFDDEYVLSLCKFLFIYYNIEGKELYKLNHQQIKEILGIKSLSNDSIDIEDVVLGNTLLVKDSDGIVLGYSNPLANMHIDEDERTLVSIEFDKKSDGSRFNLSNLEDYSNYELEELIKLCKKNKDDKTKCLIIKELHKRKEMITDYKTEKIRKLERNDKND